MLQPEILFRELCSLNVYALSQIHVEASILNVPIFGDRPLKEVVKIK